MPTNSTAIADIEQQIAKVTAQLEQARAQQFAAAEKAYLTAQKAAEQARTKVRDLTAKGTTTVAAQNRLLTAQANSEELDIKLTAALEVYDALKEQKKATEKFAKKVGKVLAGKKLGKKIKLTREEKDVVKEDKKNAKKAEKADRKRIKKAEKNNAAEEQKVTLEAADEMAPTTQKPVVKKIADKKAPVKKTPAKKVPAKNVVSEEKEDTVSSALETEIAPETEITEPTKQAPVTDVEAVESEESRADADTDVESVSTGEDSDDPKQDSVE
ncbi:MAG: hypothetical protein EOO52_17140 [Gammaproteobacteria bacterium]|nr:MAG: hypothetical protein EOO52_17140 [Gammaproteobacteria bacterium]